MENELVEIKRKILPIIKRYGIRKAEIFGSFARGEYDDKSDVDILIRPPKDMSMIGLSSLKIELEEAFGRKIDLVSYDYVNPLLKKSISEKREVVL